MWPVGWVTSLSRQLGGVGGTVPGLAGSRHTTPGATSRKLVDGIVLCCASFPGQVPPPTGVQVKSLPLNCAVNDQPTSVPRLSMNSTWLRFPTEVWVAPFRVIAAMLTFGPASLTARPGLTPMTGCVTIRTVEQLLGLPFVAQEQLIAVRVNGAAACSAGGPVWLATSGIGPVASLTVSTVIEPVKAPLVSGASCTESAVWPELAVVKATVTGPPCGFQLEPDSDTDVPPPQPPEKLGLAASVGAAVWMVIVAEAVTARGPPTGVVLGSVTVTVPFGGVGLGTVSVPLNAGGT